jgi:hypothetical protein
MHALAVGQQTHGCQIHRSSWRLFLEKDGDHVRNDLELARCDTWPPRDRCGFTRVQPFGDTPFQRQLRLNHSRHQSLSLLKV